MPLYTSSRFPLCRSYSLHFLEEESKSAVIRADGIVSRLRLRFRARNVLPELCLEVGRDGRALQPESLEHRRFKQAGSARICHLATDKVEPFQPRQLHESGE